MLQNIRQNSQGTAAKVIIGLIVISFAFFGIQSILVGGGGNEVAEVNGDAISAQELQQSVAQQTRRLISMMGENYDPAMLDEDRIRSQAMESLIGRKMMTQSVAEMGLTVSAAEIGAQVAQMEQFQVDGQFDATRYKLLLAENGYTPALFKQALTEDLMLAQLRTGIAGSEFSTPIELKVNAGVIAEQRDFRYLTILGSTVRGEQSVSEAAIEAHYQEFESRYLTEESVDLEYLELSLDSYREPVSEESLEAAFQELLQDYQASTEHRVSHILIAQGDEAAIAQRVQAVQAQLAEGAGFAELAKEFSDDVGSASRGGDLGYTSGDAFPEEVEAAVAGLALEEVSAPVQTDAGTHLLLVTERRDAKPPTLAGMRPQLEESLQEEEARVALLRDVELLRDLSFNADDLRGPAEEVVQDVQQIEGVIRTSGTGLFESQALRDAAFSEDVLIAGHNSEVIELSDSRFVVLRVQRHNEAQLRALEEVRAEIETELAEQQAREAVAQKAQAVIASIRGGQSVEDIATAQGYEWQAELGVSRTGFAADPQVMQRVFAMPAPAQESTRDYLVTAAGDAVVIELTRVQPGEFDTLPLPEQTQLGQRLVGEQSMLVDSEYQQSLRQSADIVVM